MSLGAWPDKAVCYVHPMTKLLASAVEHLRGMRGEDQDAIALILLSVFEPNTAPELDEAARLAIREGLAEADRGEFVPDEEIAALWARHAV